MSSCRSSAHFDLWVCWRWNRAQVCVSGGGTLPLSLPPCVQVSESLWEPSAVLQIASVPNYRVLMKACTPGGPTEDRLGTSPPPLQGGKQLTAHAVVNKAKNIQWVPKTDEGICPSTISPWRADCWRTDAVLLWLSLCSSSSSSPADLYNKSRLD